MQEPTKTDRSPQPDASAAPRARLAFGILAILGLVGVVLLTDPFRDRSDRSDEFRAVGIDTGSAARNEPIRIRFSGSVARSVPLRSVVHLGDDHGRAVGFTPRIDGQTVLLEPQDPFGWPAGMDLSVEVQKGHAAAFRSMDGRPLAADARFRVSIGREYRDLGESFMIEPDDHGTLVDVGRDFVYRRRFSLPIDKECLVGDHPPVIVKCMLESGRTHELVPELVVGSDGKTLDIRPWPKRSPVFDAGREHRILFLPQLRAVTGRTLGQLHQVTFVTTTHADYEGYVDVSFAIEDLDTADNPWLGPEAAFARKTPRPLTTEVLNDELRREAHTAPFSSMPCRAQIRLDGATLGEDSGLVTGFSMLTRDGVPDGLVFPRVIARIGCAVDVLTDTFDANFATDADAGGEALPHETVAKGTLGEWRPTTGDGARWVEFSFERPYYYRGRSRDLLLEIRNERGAVLVDGGAAATGVEGLRWIGGRAPAGTSPTTLVTVDGDSLADRGVLQDSRFATKVHIERYVDLESRWYEAEIDRPIWWILPASGELDADGRENEDFRFRYKAIGPDGVESKDWLPLVHQVNGCRKIKVKVSFLPNSRERADPYPEVRRLRIRYRQGK